MGKKGQVTIYIVVAIVIVAAVISVYLFYPQIRTITGGELNPTSFLQTRIEMPIENSVKTLSSQGGYADPEGFIQYQGNNVKYLCYNSEYYLPCKVQQPMIKQLFEQELKKLIEEDVKEAFQELKEQYERKGYEVSSSNLIKTNVEIIPERIKVKIDSPLSITKEASQTYDNFELEFPSKMYFLLMTATSIIDYEATYGDSETSLYIQYYPNLIIEKNKLGDGSKIYTIREVTSDESFTFASRSVAWPGGLGLTENG